MGGGSEGGGGVGSGGDAGGAEGGGGVGGGEGGGGEGGGAGGGEGEWYASGVQVCASERKLRARGSVHPTIFSGKTHLLQSESIAKGS